jgi:hypothetical protein
MDENRSLEILLLVIDYHVLSKRARSNKIPRVNSFSAF